MLILTRRVGETIIIGDDIKISNLGVQGKQVRLGIQAPSTIAVHREEIYERIQQEKSSGINDVNNIDEIEDSADAGVLAE